MNNGEKKDNNDTNSNSHSHSVDNQLENEAITNVKKIFERYKDSPNMKQKINHYIKDILPGFCENASQQQKQREDRKNTLEEKSD